METMSLCFRIAVNQNAEAVVSALRNQFVMQKESAVKWKISKNIAEIYHNEDHDASLALTDADGYLYYKTNMDFYPSGQTTPDMQIQLAKEIKHYFDGFAWQSEIIAEFEPLL